MTTSKTSADSRPGQQSPVEAAVKVGILLLWATWCYRILVPFSVPLIWGVIIAVTVFPLHKRISRLFGQRPRIASIVVTVGLLVVLGGPVLLLSEMLVHNVHGIAEDFSDGTIDIPPPPEGIDGWPVIGPRLGSLWRLASVRMDLAFKKLGPELQAVSHWLLSTGTNIGLEILKFIAGLLIAGVLLVHPTAGRKVGHGIARRLAGQQRGEHLASLAESTVRGVARGVIGVALLEALLSGLGLLVCGVPFAGLWTVVCIVLAIAQAGVLPVMVPAVIYVFSTADPTTGVILLVWTVVVGMLENIVKPMVMSHGLAVPMPVIFIGALSGMILWGIVGLFVGAVVLALGHALFKGWLAEEPGRPDAPGPEPG